MSKGNGKALEETGFNGKRRDRTGRNVTCKRFKPQTTKATQNTNNKKPPPEHSARMFKLGTAPQTFNAHSHK